MGIWKYALFVFLGGCSYGVVSTFVKLAYGEGFTQGEITGSQYLMGALMLWLVALFVPKVKLSGKQIVTLLISGFPMGLTGIFYNQSLTYIDASFAIILLLQFTWISMVLQYIFEKKVPGKKNIMATVVILAGSILASGVLASNGDLSIAGIIWGLLSATSFASFIVVSGRSAIKIHPIYKSALMTTGAAMLILIVFPPVFIIDGVLMDGLFKYSIIAGVCASVIPPILFNFGMPKIGSGLGTILSASELPTAVFMSALVLNETVTSVQWIGVLIILCGIAYPNIKLRVKRQVQTESMDW